MDFWERLKLEVKKNNTSQEWLARSVGVPYGTLRKWLTNHTMPNADQAQAIARALGVTVEYLLTGQNEAMLVSGESGQERSKLWVNLNRDLVTKLMRLSKQELSVVDATVTAMLDNRESQTSSTSA